MSDDPPVRAAVLATTRADLGPLGPVLTALAARPDVDLLVWTAVGFDEAGLRAAAAGEGVELGTAPVRCLVPVRPLATADDVTVLLGELASGAGRALREDRPHVLLVLGDRWELAAVVPVAVFGGVPVVHVHGGEVTEGALDDRVRHATTKLADTHCVASPAARHRLLQLGEPPQRVHLTGAPGLDRLRDLEPFSAAEFEQRFGLPLRRPLVVTTVHPETAGDTAAGPLAAAVFEEVAEAAGTVVATHPGHDPGRQEVLAQLALLATRPGAVVVESLGRDYGRLLRTADLVVGNSSSGVIEAPALGVPVVDVGARQRGRESGPGVVHCGPQRPQVREAIARALSPHVRLLAAAGAGAGPPAAGAIAEQVVATARRGQRTKAFGDVPFTEVPPPDVPPADVPATDRYQEVGRER